MSAFPPLVKALALSPKPFALLSIAGSAYIFQDVIRSRRKRGQPYHRLVAAMSFCDIIGSIGAFLGTWPIPRGTPGVYMASGTTQTCIAAGFFNQLVGPCTPMYNAALGIYYVCYIRYSMPEARIKRIEMICHFVIISIGVCTSIAAIPLDLYNNADNWVCWISEQPIGCLDSNRYGDQANCERGDNAWIYQWAWFYSLAWASFLVNTVSLALVYNGVLEVERSLDSYDMSGRTRRDSSNSIFWQGVLYWASFLMTWIFTTTTRVIFLTSGKIYIWMLFLLATFWPLQGFWNCLIYLRPRYLKFKRKYPDKSFCDMVSYVLIKKGLKRDYNIRSTRTTASSIQPFSSRGSRKSGQSEPSNYISSNLYRNSVTATSNANHVTSNAANNGVDGRVGGGDEVSAGTASNSLDVVDDNAKFTAGVAPKDTVDVVDDNTKVTDGVAAKDTVDVVDDNAGVTAKDTVDVVDDMEAGDSGTGGGGICTASAGVENSDAGKSSLIPNSTSGSKNIIGVEKDERESGNIC